MATKKQKRLAGEKKQAANREANRLLGLRAQARDHARRESKQKDAEAALARKSEKELADKRRGGVQEAVAKMAAASAR